MFGRERTDYGSVLARAYNGAVPEERMSAMCRALGLALGAAVVAYYVRDRGGYALEYRHVATDAAVEGIEDAEPANAAMGVSAAIGRATVVEPASDRTSGVEVETTAPTRIAYDRDLAQAGVWEGAGRPMGWLPLGSYALLFGPFDRVRHARRTVESVARSSPIAEALLRSVGEQAELTRSLRQQKQTAESTNDVLASNLDMGALLEALIQQAARSSRHAGAFVGQREAEAWHVKAATGMPEAFAAQTRARGVESLFELVELGETTLVQPAPVEVQQAFGVRTLLLFPIESDGVVIGVLGLANRRKAGAGAEDYDAMAGFAEQISLVVAREQQLMRFSDAYEETLLTLCEGLDLARGCRGHHEKVAGLARRICVRLDYSEEDCALVHRAARVHDIGLLPSSRTPDDVLIEFQHPHMGRTLVEPLPEGARLGRIIAQHHETHDGFGFPEALTGEELDPLGHVLAVAEWVVERATGNAVAPGLDGPSIAEELSGREAGTRFSEPVAAAAAELLRRGHLFVVTEPEDG